MKDSEIEEYLDRQREEWHRQRHRQMLKEGKIPLFSSCVRA